MRCIGLLIMLCAMLVATGAGQVSNIDPALPGQVKQSWISRIADPDGKREGKSTLVFPPGTGLADTLFNDMVSYEGEWRAGLAEGQGLIRLSPSPALGETAYGQMASPSRETTNYYLGNFSGGRPTGEGDFVYRDPFGSMRKISGLFSDQLIVSIEGQDRAVMTRVGGEQPKVLIRLMQYQHSQSRLPSRIFFGESTDGIDVPGEWVDVPWYEFRGSETRAGYGPNVEGSRDDGSSYSCKYEEWGLPAQTPQIKGPFDLFRMIDANTGMDFRYRSKATCVSRTVDGWSFSHEIDFKPPLPKIITTLGCKTPDGKAGTLSGSTGCSYKRKRKRNHDIFTNMGQELGRFMERRVIGTGNKFFGELEKALCRLTGTKEGENCHVNGSVGATWPVGEGPADNIPKEEEAARQRYIAASKRASQISDDFGKTALGETAGLTAELNAICNALCDSGSQQRYSAALLSELERIADLPANDSRIRTIASVNRETASVVSTGLRVLTIGVTVAGSSIAFNRFRESAKHEGLILSAIDAVNAVPGQRNTFEELKRKNQALATLYNLNNAHLIGMASQGTNLLGESIKSRIRILRGFPPQRATALSLAITLGKTGKQVDEFVEKYKDVKSEEELYNAIISEAVAPLGIKWPPPGGGQ